MVDKAMLAKKVEDSKKVIREAYEKYPLENMAVAWTGGKDSTVLLWILLEVCKEDGKKPPKCFCIDEGDMFDEIRSFLDTYKKEWIWSW